jgi:hypothetical protein
LQAGAPLNTNSNSNANRNTNSTANANANISPSALPRGGIESCSFPPG